MKRSNKDLQLRSIVAKLKEEHKKDNNQGRTFRLQI